MAKRGPKPRGLYYHERAGMDVISHQRHYRIYRKTSMPPRTILCVTVDRYWADRIVAALEQTEKPEREFVQPPDTPIRDEFERRVQAKRKKEGLW